MVHALSFLSAPDTCSYLPDRVAQMRYEVALDLTATEFMTRLQDGWRRFGPIMFRHECPSCRACESLRVPVASFRPSTGQRRTWKRNSGTVEIRIGTPAFSPEKLDLFRRFHRHGHETKGWPAEPGHDLSLFIQNPYPIEEWSYYVRDTLVGVGYVDPLPEGLSAIYFFHDPREAQRSLGTFNILEMITVAAARGLPHVYLGYFVDGCRSLEYKAKFAPNERLTSHGWTASSIRREPLRT